MQIHKLTFNPFAENTYLMVGSKKSSIIIDPGMADRQESERLEAYLQTHELKLVGCLLTHAHIDHVLGLDSIHQRYGFIARAHVDSKVVNDANDRVAEMYGIPYTPGPEPKYDLEVDEVIMLDDTRIEMRYLPGHAPGHVVFIDHGSKQVVAGDTLFNRSIGRTDLPGGDHDLLLEKIKTELYSLDDDYVVWPGHGPSTTIGEEKRENPFVRV